MENKKEEEIKESLKEVVSALCKDTEWYEYAHVMLGTNKDIIESIFDNYFDIIEGPSCCHDKSAYTAHMLLKALNDKKDYSLKMTYRESNYSGRFSEEELDNKCYWCPITIDDTKDAFNVLSSMINPKRLPKLLETKTKLFSERS